jgi:hypothetical protein
VVGLPRSMRACLLGGGGGWKPPLRKTTAATAESKSSRDSSVPRRSVDEQTCRRAAWGDLNGNSFRVAHYPSYCSKYNPIEHRFFPHVGRACQGKVFDTLETVVRLMRRTSTRTGLQTTVNVIAHAYEIGSKVANDFKTTMSILFDNLLPNWNDRAIPQIQQ